MADKGVNEDLYNWINKSYGLQPAEWYRNNPQKPSESNPFLPKGSYVPKASADDPYRGAVASTQDPYRDPLQPGATEKQPLFSTTNVKTINDYTQEELATLPFDQLLRALANTPEGTEDKSGLGLDYEGFVSSLQGQPSFFGATVPQGVQLAGGIFTPIEEIPESYNYGPLNITYQDGKPAGIAQGEFGTPSYYTFRKYLDDPKAKSIYQQQREILERVWETPKDDPMSDVLYQQSQDKVKEVWDYAQEFSKQYAGQLREPFRDMQYGSISSLPSRADLQSIQSVDQEIQQDERNQAFEDTLVAATYPSDPKWFREIDKLYKEVKNKPYRPGDPKPGRGMGDIWPRVQKEQDGKFESALATAMKMPDQKRQLETFQSEYDPQKSSVAEFDPQKAREAVQAARDYRIGSDNKDPFRSMSAA